MVRYWPRYPFHPTVTSVINLYNRGKNSVLLTSADECRNEVLDCLGSGTKHIKGRKHPSPPVHDSHFHSLPMSDMSLGACSVAQAIMGKSLCCEQTLLWWQELGGGRPVGHDVPSEKTKEWRAATFNNLWCLISTDILLPHEVSLTKSHCQPCNPRAPLRFSVWHTKLAE